MAVSHYRASWISAENWADPQWPMPSDDGRVWDRDREDADYREYRGLQLDRRMLALLQAN
jgi:hypothetical protein